MDKYYLEKEIDYYKDLKNNTLTIFLVTISGTLTTIMNLDNIFKGLLVIIGVFLSIILFNSYLDKQSKVRFFIKELKKEINN